MTDPKALHQSCIVIDNTCPLAVVEAYHDNYLKASSGGHPDGFSGHDREQ